MIKNVQTIQIGFDRGGLTANPNIDKVEPYMMVWPSRNINMHNNVRQTRGGTSIVSGYPISGNPSILGLCDFTMMGGNQYIISAASDGCIYNGPSTIIDVENGDYLFNFEIGEDTLFIAKGGYVSPVIWQGGANVAQIAHPATDWGSYPPFQFIRHGRGNSQRMWALNYQKLYASKNNDMQDFSDANVITLPIDTGDGFGLVGAVEFGNELIALGKRKTYRVYDSPSDTSEWGYNTSQWEGGAASWRLIVKTPNDLICMMEDGEIYSVIAVQQYGDYRTASLTRPAFIHKWIQENVDLSRIDQFHAVYDPFMRMIKFFICKYGSSTVNAALVYHIDRPPTEAWIVHDNDYEASHGYRACSSAIVRKAAGTYKIYTGDYAGNLWELETANKNDGGAGFYAGFTIPKNALGNARQDKLFTQARITMDATGNYDLQTTTKIDGSQDIAGTASMVGTGGLLDYFVLDMDVLGGADIIEPIIDIGQKGKRIQMELYNATEDQKFIISGVMIDFQPLGPNP
jgi:hypothetical protein